MADNKDVKRGIVLYLDGKQVEANAQNIQREMRKVKREIDGCTFGSKEYVEATKRYRELNGILQEHRSKLREVKTEHFSFVNTVNSLWQKWNVTIGAFMAAFAGVSLALSKFRKEMNATEDSSANLKALTGLDDQSIAWLREQAEQLSTTMDESGLRIQQSAQNILEAYMLVGSAKPELLKDKEALNAVTVEALRLSSAAGMDLRAAVDGVTLAMNQYGAAADEASRYVNVLAAGSKAGSANVESQTTAITKAGVAASTAKVPIESLVGSIETLAEKGIKGEVAGTGLKTFFLKLEGMADDVRPSVVGLETALENLRKKNLSTAETQRMFGLEAFTVARAMIDGADKVREYTAAVTDTNVAVEQAAINSDTENAKLAQKRNEFTQQGIILVRELNPAITKFVSLGMNSTRMLVSLVRFLTQYRTTLTVTTAAIALYITWANRKVIQDKLVAFWQDQVVVGAYKVRYAFMKNPWGIALVAIAAVTAALIDYNRRLGENIEKGRALKKLDEEVENEFGEKRSRIEMLNRLVHDETAGYEARNNALNELKSLVPDYHASLSEEGRLINDNVKAITDYIKNKEKEIRLKAAEDDLEEAIRNKRKKQKERNQAMEDAERARQNQARSANSVYGGSQGNTMWNIGQVAGADDRVASLDREINNLNQDIKDLYDEIKKGGGIASAIITGDNDDGGGGSGGSGGASTAAAKAVDIVKQQTAAIDLELQRRATILKQMYAQGKIDREEYNQELEDLEIERINRILQIAGLEPDKVAELQSRLQDIAVKAREELDKLQPSANSEYEETANRAKALEDRMKQELATLKRNLRLKNITQKQFDDESKRIDTQFFLDSTNLWKEYYDHLTEISKAGVDEMSEETQRKLDLFRETLAPVMESIGASLGEGLAKSIKEGNAPLKEALKEMLKTVISAIQKLMVANITKRTVENVGALGFWGLAKAAGEIALITAAGAGLNALLDGWASGGYTGTGGAYEPAGTVHKNEFVANRFALSNPAVRSVLDVIDQAQRSGSVANLTSDDLQSVGASSASSNDAALALVASAVKDCTDMLAVVKARFDEPIVAETYAAGKGGTIEAERKVQTMLRNANRR